MVADLTPQETAHIAQLARLELTPAELAQYTQELGAILDYVNQLQSLNTRAVAVVGSVTGQVNNLQTDQPGGEPIKRDRFLAAAPAAQPPYLKVKAVLEAT